MAVDVSDESVWAVIALLFLGIEFGSSGAGDTIFTVPEGEVGWAVASVGSFVPDSSGSLLIGWALADVVGVEGSWGSTWDSAVALLGGVVVYVIGWARSASHVD